MKTSEIYARTVERALTMKKFEISEEEKARLLQERDFDEIEKKTQLEGYVRTFINCLDYKLRKKGIVLSSSLMNEILFESKGGEIEETAKKIADLNLTKSQKARIILEAIDWVHSSYIGNECDDLYHTIPSKRFRILPMELLGYAEIDKFATYGKEIFTSLNLWTDCYHLSIEYAKRQMNFIKENNGELAYEDTDERVRPKYTMTLSDIITKYMNMYDKTLSYEEIAEVTRQVMRRSQNLL